MVFAFEFNEYGPIMHDKFVLHFAIKYYAPFYTLSKEFIRHNAQTPSRRSSESFNAEGNWIFSLSLLFYGLFAVYLHPTFDVGFIISAPVVNDIVYRTLTQRCLHAVAARQCLFPKTSTEISGSPWITFWTRFVTVWNICV